MESGHVYLLLPCHSLEDFPIDDRDTDADQLLTYWTAPWHPAIITSTSCPPKWHRMDDLPQEFSDVVLLVPRVSRTAMPVDLPDQAASRNASVISQVLTRAALVDQIAEELAACSASRLIPVEQVDQELVADFYALGYWRLQIELLTRKMRYTSCLDHQRFDEVLLQAAAAACHDARHDAQQALQRCYDMLADERDHYYPVDSFLFDVALVAPESNAQAIRRELSGPLGPSRPLPKNLWMTGETLTSLAGSSPELVQEIAERVESRSSPASTGGDDRDGWSDAISLIGGEWDESPTSLVSLAAWQDQLRTGIDAFQKVLGSRPHVFFRRRFGTLPTLIESLSKMSFTGAVLATLDEGRFPRCPQSRVCWQGPTHFSVDAVGQIPLDASKPETFLRLAMTMGESMERDFVAAVCLVHWAGHVSPWMSDVQRGHHYGLRIGKFITLDSFFAMPDEAHHVWQSDVGSYHSPYLQQQIADRAVDPISQWVDAWNRELQLQSTAALRTWAAVLGATRKQLTSAGDDGLVESIDRQLSREPAESATPAVDSQMAPTLAINTGSAPLRFSGKDASTMIPAYGFSVTSAAEGAVEVPEVPSDRGAVSIEGDSISNGVMSAHVDPSTGGLQALYAQNVRGNRLSQRLVHRATGSAQMECDSIEKCISGDAAELVASGRLVNNDQVLAEFRQTFRLESHSRLLRLRVLIQPQVELTRRPWLDHFSIGWAYSSRIEVLRWLHGRQHPVESGRFDAPMGFQLCDGPQATSVFTAGLPFHQIVDDQRLDTLLVVAGQTPRELEVAVGIDLPLPLHTARIWPLPIPQTTTIRSYDLGTGWLFFVDAKHLIASHWRPVWDERDQCVGFAVRFTETAGKAGKATLQCFQPIGRAWTINQSGQWVTDLEVHNGHVVWNFRASEWTEVECRW